MRSKDIGTIPAVPLYVRLVCYHANGRQSKDVILAQTIGEWYLWIRAFVHDSEWVVGRRGSLRSRRIYIQGRELVTQTISYNRYTTGGVNIYVIFFNKDIRWTIMKDAWPLWPSCGQ